MFRKKTFLTCVLAAFFLASGGALYHFLTYQRITRVIHFRQSSIMWSDGPRVELNPENVAKINKELAAMIQTEAPGREISCLVVSKGEAHVDINFSGDMSDALENKLIKHCDERVLKLAEEQAWGAR